MVEPIVTIVVVPREQFSSTRDSLESVFRHTESPFKLICVDGGSPRQVQRYLEARAREKGFRLIRSDRYLPTNQARNIGLEHVTTKYVVFLENDMVVAPHWLQRLVKCAEETGAAIVGPLICQGEPLHQVVHFAGGKCSISQEEGDGRLLRRLDERIFKQGEKVVDVRERLRREPTELAELHCMLVRSEIFERIGPLDEALLNTKEHVDLCLAVSQAGGVIYFEPESVVTYLASRPITWADVSFYMLRWSDAWEIASLHRLRDKWDLTEDEYFNKRYNNLGWRRNLNVIRPLVRALTLGRGSYKLSRILIPLERLLNHYYVQFAR